MVKQPPYIPRMDAAGVIDVKGRVSDRSSIGQSAIAVVNPTSPRKGAYAECIVVPEESGVRAPAGMSMAAASTLLMSALTAHLALEALNVSAGDALAVTGPAGRVPVGNER
jgi:NADPH:quinone reductase-like Zn-dependent oxidoreductase